MIKLTYLYYKLKTEALRRYHNIAEHNSGLMFEWENAVERARSVGDDYPPKPFIEPFDFKDSDYVMTEKPLRIRPKDVLYYRENIDNVSEITIDEGMSYTVKETIEELDILFGI